MVKPEILVADPMPVAVTRGVLPPDPVRAVFAEPFPRSETPFFIVMSPLKVPEPTVTTSPDTAMFTACWTFA